MTYSEFKAEMTRLLIECGKHYNLASDLSGKQKVDVFLVQMAELSDQYPEHDELWENELLNEG